MKSMTSQIQTLKGFRDFLPEEALERDWLKNRITEIFELWGYDPIETPTLEMLELFEGQIGEDEKLFYQFTDPGGRQVALRYDQTVPACRVVGQNFQELPTPFKRYQIQPAYRAEKPQKGRYREFLQCDADIFGIDSPYADAEVIALSLDIYQRLGFPQAKVLINDRQLLKDFPYEAIVAIDKLKKIGSEGVVQDMINKGIDQAKAQEYLDTIPNLEPNETIQIILSYLKNQGFDANWYEFDPTIARSFSYSSGPIWEIEIPGFDVGSVLGGERFDQLIQNTMGVSIPATGFGLGFDRTLQAAKQFNLIPKLQTNSQVLVTFFNLELVDSSLTTTNALRNAGINSETFPDPSEKISKQLDYANKKNIPFVIIIGPDEAKEDKVSLKNMTTGDQQTLTIDEVISQLSTNN